MPTQRKTLRLCQDGFISQREGTTMPTLSKQIIEAAIDGFEAQKQRIDAQIAELRTMLNGGPPTRAAEPKPGKGRRKISPEALQRMREGQQRRWAKVRVESTPAVVAPNVAKPKRKLSAAGRRNIVKALKKRWAAKKAANEGTPVVNMAKKAGRKKAA
jgi:hypothetical protein